MTGWIKGCSVCCVCATAAAATQTHSKNLCPVLCLCYTAAATKTNPPKKKTVRLDDGTNLGLL
jgi:hypothetical protein